MKKTIIGLAAACAALVSCNRENIPGRNDYFVDTVPVEITINSETITRAGFFDDALSVPDAKERQLDIVNVYVYNDADERVYYEQFVDSGSGKFVKTLQLPRELCGTTCTFYFTGNADLSLSGTTTHFKNAYYNVNTGFPHEEESCAVMLDPAYWESARHFLMSASKQIFIHPYGHKTYACVELSRVEAKVAIRIKVADDFSAMYSGATLTVTDVTVRNLTNSVYLFRDRPFEDWNRSMSQQPMIVDGYLHNLFYIFPRGNYSNAVNIVISGIYDYDGDPATTDDQTPVEFDVPVSETGEVDRNHFYRIDCLIKGVGKKYLDLNFTAQPWVDIWQDIEVGSNN